MRLLRTCLAVAVFAGGTVHAQAAPPPATSAPSTVKWVRGERPKGELRLGDEVCVGVTGYEALRTQAAAVPKPITLWLNWSRFEARAQRRRDLLETGSEVEAG